jgi:predicted nucleic acid-binding protein
MPYLIDSDWLIDHLAGISQAVEFLDSLAPEGLAISVITFMEVSQGIERSPDPEIARSKFSAFLDVVPVIPFETTLAKRCAHLRETLRQQGKRVSSRALDLMIAATAIENDLTLVTRNLEDYEDISELKLYQRK